MQSDTRDGVHPHLELIVEGKSSERRKRPGFSGSPPDSDRRKEFTPKLNEAANRLETQFAEKAALKPGIQPHLVFRVPIRKNQEQSIVKHLNEVGMTVVSIEPDRACVAFQDEADLTKFRKSIAGYAKGPREGVNPNTGKPYSSTSFDVLDVIVADQMRLWDRSDRVGLMLANKIGAAGDKIEETDVFLVDVELWHAGSTAAVSKALSELRAALGESVDENDERNKILDEYAGDGLILVRARVTGDVLNTFLEMDFVAEVELPPKPDLTASSSCGKTKADFPVPPAPVVDGPRVCVIDSGIVSSHPLLRNNVGGEASILTQVNSPADQNGHGTMVSGLAVFGDVRACYDSNDFSSPIWLYSARVLNDQNEFDDNRLILTQMRDAVQHFKAEPYSCRVFNASICGTKRPVVNLGGRQSEWAEALDRIAREEQVILVVASGNWPGAFTDNQQEAERLFRGYPEFILRNESALTEPATAAIPITVGSLIQHTRPAQSQGGRIVRLVGGEDSPSPFTRSGPGINGAIKPEFVHYGGGLVFHKFGYTARISSESGTSIMSLSYEPTRHLFRFDVGSSFSAPRVANIAAKTQHALTSQVGYEASPNLVRAVLATSATVPEGSHTVLDPIGDHAVIRVCGYGVPHLERAVHSTDRRVTMVAARKITIDHFDVFEVPIPDCFKQAKGRRTITVALAYDPPVRARRADYLGVLMDMYLIKGKSVSEIREAFKKVEPGEDPDKSLPQKYQITLSPRSQGRKGYSRKRSTLQRASKSWTKRESQKKDFGNSYFLVVRAERKWAPSEIETQDYAVAVTLEADDVHLYTQVSLRVQARQRQRVKPKARVKARASS